MQIAGAVGHEFGIDPVIVLKAGIFDWSVRLAAHNHNAKMRREESERAKAEAKRKG